MNQEQASMWDMINLTTVILVFTAAFWLLPIIK